MGLKFLQPEQIKTFAQTIQERIKARAKIRQDYIHEAFDEYQPIHTKGRQTLTIVIALLIGVLAAYGAISFRYMIRFVHLIFFSTNEYTLEILYSLPWWHRLIFPFVGALFVGIIVTKIAPEVKGSGIPEVMEAVARKGGIIRLRVLLTKAVAAAITIGSGGSAGREGPIVHIGSAIGSTIGQMLGLSAKNLRTFVACGAAAAIAATFNAPIAGALFALEVIVGEMRVVNMPHIIMAAVIATVISRHHLGDFPAFHVPAYEMISPLELVWYALLGVLAGLISFLFIKTLTQTSILFEKLKISPWLKPCIGGLCVGSIAIFLPHVFGVGYATINNALWNQLGLSLLIMVLFAKLLATSLTLGSGASGGIFAPSLFLGVSLGAAFGQVVHQYFPLWTATPGAYALVGMGAVVAGVTHAPISAILIVFELTNNYLIFPPLMLACIISLLISYQLSPLSIYLAKLESKGVRLFKKKDINLLRNMMVNEVMTKTDNVIHAQTSLSKVIQTLFNTSQPFIVVVDDKDTYLGTIELNDVREIIPQSEMLADIVIADDIANKTLPFVLPEDNLDLVMHIFGKIGRDQIAVCDNSRDKKVLGIVTKTAVINAYNFRIFQEDLTGGFLSVMQSAGEGRSIEVMSGLHLAEIETPSSFIGKSIRQIDLRNKYGLEIIMVHQDSENIHDLAKRPGQFPLPGLVLKPGDKLLVLGNPRDIYRLRKY